MNDFHQVFLKIVRLECAFWNHSGDSKISEHNFLFQQIFKAVWVTIFPTPFEGKYPLVLNRNYSLHLNELLIVIHNFDSFSVCLTRCLILETNSSSWLALCNLNLLWGQSNNILTIPSYSEGASLVAQW